MSSVTCCISFEPTSHHVLLCSFSHWIWTEKNAVSTTWALSVTVDHSNSRPLQITWATLFLFATFCHLSFMCAYMFALFCTHPLREHMKRTGKSTSCTSMPPPIHSTAGLVRHGYFMSFLEVQSSGRRCSESPQRAEPSPDLHELVTSSKMFQMLPSVLQHKWFNSICFNLTSFKNHIEDH